MENDIELTVHDLANNGCGVAKDPATGKILFIPDSVPGDRLTVTITADHKNYAEAEIYDTIAYSPNRIVPDCILSGVCGGCCFRHIRYETELTAKENFIRSAFSQAKMESIEMKPMIGSPLLSGYRNKAEFAVRRGSDGQLRIGFTQRGSHEVINLPDCRILPPEFIAIKEKVRGLMNQYSITAFDEESGEGEVRHLILRKSGINGKLLLCFVVNGKTLTKEKELCAELQSAFPEISSIYLNENTESAGMVMAERSRLLKGNARLSDRIRNVPVQIGPQSFFQVNTPAAELLYETIKDFADVKKNETILDLYCGMGTIGLSLAGDCRHLIGCEIIDEAVQSTKHNAAAMGLRNTEFLKGDAGKIAEKLAGKGNKPDVIILDPPRKGCDRKTLDAVIAMSPSRIVSVSCNPSTAARDAAYLRNAGYTLGPIQGVDLFPRTQHVETVVLLSKG